jgi:hypothetical protein
MIPYRLPAQPDFGDLLVQIVTTTEGGTYDAINMYDTCIISIGLIQLCEKLFLVSNMLGECAKTDLSAVQNALKELPIPASLQKDGGKWFIGFTDSRGPANLPDKMRTLYFGGATGEKGKWEDKQKQYAKEVAAAFASMWNSPELQTGQLRYVKARIMSFIMPRSKQILFSNDIQDGYEGALKAAFVSFSLNLPAVADKWLFQTTQNPAWAGSSSKDRFFLAMKNITFGPQIAIWPGRYDKIHPVLEKLFQVSIPSLKELADGINHSVSDEDLTTIEGIQKALAELGYDLGPKGPDGVMGKKTTSAIAQFQTNCNTVTRDQQLPRAYFVVDGIVGKNTRAALLQALEEHRSAEER